MGNLKTTQELIEFAKASMEQTGYSTEYISALSNTWNALKQYLSGKAYSISRLRQELSFYENDTTSVQIARIASSQKWTNGEDGRF